MNLQTIRNACFVSLILICACESAYADFHVVATTPDFAAIAKTIGGDTVEVTTLAKPSEDPHFVDAKPSFIVKLNRADALIEGGAELEIGWLPALLEQARNDKLAIGAPGRIRCSEVVTLLEVPSSLDRSEGDVHAAGNPHFMVDPLNAKKVAEHITRAFCALQSEHCAQFQENNRTFGKHLDEKLTEWNDLLAPFRNVHVVAYHNSWLYFGKRFDLQIDLFLEPKPGIPPTPAHLAEVISRMKSEHIQAILVDPYQNRQTAESVARNTGGIVVEVSQFPGGIKGTEDSYIALIDTIVHSLAQALRPAN